MKNILIIGATSAIAQATARLWAIEGNHFLPSGTQPRQTASTGTRPPRPSGELDEVPEQAFLNVGGIEQVLAKSKQLQEDAA